MKGLEAVPKVVAVSKGVHDETIAHGRVTPVGMRKKACRHAPAVPLRCSSPPSSRIEALNRFGVIAATVIADHFQGSSHPFVHRVIG